MNRIEEIEAELAASRERQAELVAEWSQIKGKELDARLNALTEADGDFTLETAMQVDLDECGNRSYGSTWWKMITEFLERLTRDGGSLDGLYRTGINPDAGGQAAFSIKLDQNRPLADQQGPHVLLPFVKAVGGWKNFEIFEHTLSAGGSWYFRVSEKGDTAEVWDHRSLRYAQDYSKPEFKGSVDDALAYIYDRHPYEKLKGTEYEDD